MRAGGRRSWLAAGALLAAVPWLAAAWHVDGAQRDAMVAQLQRHASLARGLEAPTLATIGAADRVLLDAKRRIEQGEPAPGALAQARATAGDLLRGLGMESGHDRSDAELHIGLPERTGETGGTLPLSRVVRRGDGTERDGTIVARLDAGRLRRLLDAVSAGPASTVVMAGADGVIRVAASPTEPDRARQQRATDPVPTFVAGIVRRSVATPDGAEVIGQGDDARLVAWRRLATIPLVVVVSSTVGDVLPDWAAYRDAVLALAALASAGLVAITALAGLAMRVQGAPPTRGDGRTG